MFLHIKLVNGGTEEMVKSKFAQMAKDQSVNLDWSTYQRHNAQEYSIKIYE